MNTVIIEQLLKANEQSYKLLSNKENSQKRMQQLRYYKNVNYPYNDNIVYRVVNWFKSFF